MGVESNADVYAAFGVNSAVLSGSTVEEHEQAMLGLDVAARDGDDAITLDTSEDSGNQERDLYDTSDPLGVDNDEDRLLVRVGDGSDVEQMFEPNDTEGETDGGTDGGPEEFQPLGDTPADLLEATEQLGQHEAGFQEMVNAAAERGLPAESIMRIQQEYESDDGISNASYEELAKAGYSKAFVDSYIKGQEALVEQYVNSVVSFAGGREKFGAISQHLQTHNPEAFESLETALMNRDLTTVKSIINLAGQSRAKTFGRQPVRSVTKAATPAKPQAPKQLGFESRDAMVKAMSDPRYRHDAKYRMEVEQKVINSNF